PSVSVVVRTYGTCDYAAMVYPVLMLVPLVACDAMGHRVGNGAGCYDRAIEVLKAKDIVPRLIGIAFDCQQVERVPDEQHDVTLPEILTETGLRPFPLTS